MPDTPAVFGEQAIGYGSVDAIGRPPVGYFDAALDTAKEQLRHAVGTVVDRMARNEQSQSITISCPQQEVRRFFQDAEQLSQVLGEVADVHKTDADDRLRWVIRKGPLNGVSWESVMVSEDRRLRFVDAGRNNGVASEIILDFSEAPRGRGTEVTLRIKSPAPRLVSGALAYKALYRARALLQTGEIPTISHNPSARESAR
ncbi:MAG TPA: SRPBCC family protein [Mycobacterium sp.]|uniref:SRPBCC family protein n=1 Tax=Mycobacterium sp. TaxID=1785 RepID=UPI002D6D57B2|nr:SRPBCC family protein [Mycobacterium sp.]HZU47167.1 SRPBCC family protein [Mycobacterium sp.]